MNVLIVHAHHEPGSFESAMKERLAARLIRNGHTVDISDLHAMRFDPVSDRRNFTTIKSPSYLRQHDEERHASLHGGFAPPLASEMEKVLRSDLLVFSFPLWWFGLPAILKGWVDRVMACGRMYGGELLFENGIGRGKRAMVLATTGGKAAAYGRWGVNPSLDAVLRPVHHGIFWFLGYTVLPPLVAHAPLELSLAERMAVLERVDTRADELPELDPQRFPRLAEFSRETGEDQFGRYMVEVRQKSAPDERYMALVPAEVRVRELERDGHLLFFSVSALGSDDWIGWLYFRAPDRSVVQALLESLPLYEFLLFKTREAARV